MDSPNHLEIKGSLQDNPLAELFYEIAEHRFNGSLRLAREAHKIVVYFDAGDIVFAVSNARQHRLFEKLLQTDRFSKNQIAAIADFTNDLSLRENLLKDDLMEKAEIDGIVSDLISEVLKTALSWHDGEWTFSPFVRIKGNIRFAINQSDLLIEAARNAQNADASRRFSDRNESIKVKSEMPSNVNLSPHESFVFSRFENSSLTIEEIQNLSGLPETDTFQILYALWLGGFVVRQNRSGAFSEKEIAAIQSAKLAVKKDETKSAVAEPPPVIKPETVSVNGETIATNGDAQNGVETEKTESAENGKDEISLNDYLERVEKATNFYEVFAVSPDSAAAEIKQNYFALAKRFHPDLFHKEADANLMQRIQSAFTELARAYETLKHDNSRDIYNFKIRKEITETREQKEAGATKEEVDWQKQNEQATLNFKQGFDLLMNDNPDAAVQFLARAVHFDKNNARYHAYFGKALSADKKHRHKAEAEFQTAIKLDSENADYRIMLAEFFTQVGLFKRAEGELNRLLAIFPSNREARTLLDSLQKK
jgi:curved DNA-binding protein CbpA